MKCRPVDDVINLTCLPFFLFLSLMRVPSTFIIFTFDIYASVPALGALGLARGFNVAPFGGMFKASEPQDA